MENINKSPAPYTVDALKDAIVVGEPFHFWLDEEEDVYDQSMGTKKYKQDTD